MGPAGPGSPFGPGGPIGPAVIIGNRVTLRSLLPANTSTSRASALQPEFGMETVTLCQPTATSVLMGVVLPVSLPSIDTFAPDGNELTFNVPCFVCAPMLLGTRNCVAANTSIQAILRRWVIASSWNASHAHLSRLGTLPRVWQYRGDMPWNQRNCPSMPEAHLTHFF